MLPILDKFFATTDTILHKTTFGHIKLCNDSHDLNRKFSDNSYKPCSVFFYAGNHEDEWVEDELLQSVLTEYNNHPDNELILDTIIEDYVQPPFIECLEKIFQAGVPPEKITIITSYNPADAFTHRFLREIEVNSIGIKTNQDKFDKVTVVSYNGFSSSYMLDHSDLEPPEIKARELKKHFSLLQKNSRFIRKLVHAYFIHKGYNEKSFYAWHNVGAYPDWGPKESQACDFFNIPFDPELYKTPILFDDIYAVREWEIPDTLWSTSAVAVVVETNSPRESADTLYTDFHHHKDHYFLTEKTYKNFWYGVPFIHLGMPFMDEMLQAQGYKTFRHLFDVEQRKVWKNTDGMHNDFALIDRIANMSIDELSDLLNKKEVLAVCMHNRKMLTRLLPLKNLVIDLDNLHK